MFSALGSRVNALTLRQCMEVAVKFCAKQNVSSKEEAAKWSELIALLAGPTLAREGAVFLAQSAAAYPHLVGILAKVLNVFYTFC